VKGRIKKLLYKAGAKEVIREGHFTGIKMHFGERGNLAFISPLYVKIVVEVFKELGAKVFLTDTNTLYMGSRGHAIEHLQTAFMHGFLPYIVDAPVIIADGLRGGNGEVVKIDGTHYNEVEIAREFFNLDSLLVLSHFKGHELTGFGGAIKNIGMGCATKKGKLSMHSEVRPFIEGDLCDGCQICFRWCPVDAISMKGDIAVIDSEVCIGCAECIPACPVGAVKFNWDSASKSTQEKMAEHASGVLNVLDNRIVYLSFINNVSPACDCYPHNEPPIVKDIGMVSSSDIVAIDRCSYDLVNRESGINQLEGVKEGEDKFRAMYKSVDSTIQIKHAQEMDMGFEEYEKLDI
jgi:hypothetical protein